MTPDPTMTQPLPRAPVDRRNPGRVLVVSVALKLGLKFYLPEQRPHQLGLARDPGLQNTHTASFIEVFLRSGAEGLTCSRRFFTVIPAMPSVAPVGRINMTAHRSASRASAIRAHSMARTSSSSLTVSARRSVQ